MEVSSQRVGIGGKHDLQCQQAGILEDADAGRRRRYHQPQSHRGNEQERGIERNGDTEIESRQNGPKGKRDDHPTEQRQDQDHHQLAHIADRLQAIGERAQQSHRFLSRRMGQQFMNPPFQQALLEIDQKQGRDGPHVENRPGHSHIMNFRALDTDQKHYQK